jgi:tripartite-type tricarboxylate transporter receptor subunit TctC
MQLRVLLALAAGLAGAISPLAGAQDYPSRPIRMIVPFGPGTSTDITGRIFAQALSQQLKQAVVVENKPGAGGNIGTEFVAKSAPNGYTLSFGTVGTLAINASLFRKLAFDPLRDFVPLALAGATPTLLVVRADAPYANVAELVAYAKQHPDKVSFASAGNGTSGHLAGELLKVMSGASMTHIPYKEGTQALTAVMSGQVDFMFYHPAAVMAHISSGRLKALAASSARRASAAPKVPALVESGYAGFDLVAWFMLAAPAGTPAPIVKQLLEACERVLKTPEVVRQLEAQGIEQLPVASAELPGFLAAENAKWAKIVRASGAQVD